LHRRPDCPGEDLVDGAGEVALQAPARLALRQSFGGTSVQVGAGSLVPAQTVQHRTEQSSVGLAMPAAVERCRWVLPEDASTGLTPHSAANDASLGSQCGLSPTTTSNVAAPSTP